jgi:hypothetical protein
MEHVMGYLIDLFFGRPASVGGFVRIPAARFLRGSRRIFGH